MLDDKRSGYRRHGKAVLLCMGLAKCNEVWGLARSEPWTSGREIAALGIKPCRRDLAVATSTTCHPMSITCSTSRWLRGAARTGIGVESELKAQA